MTAERVYCKRFYQISFSGLLSAFILLWALSNPTGCWANTTIKEAWQGVILAPTTSVKTLQPALNQFTDKQRQNNIKNASIYSLALINMAEEKGLSPSVKELLTTTAIAISPSYSFPETAYSKLMFRQHRYLTSLISFFKAVKKFQRNPLESLYASTFFWLAVAFTPLTLLFFSALFFSVKYYRAFCEMGWLKLSRKGGLTTLCTALAAAILFITVPAPLPSLLLLAIALALLATRRDIITLSLLVTALLIVPLAYEKGMASLLALDSSFFKAARSSSSGVRNQNGKGDEFRLPATNQSQLTLQLFSQAESAHQRQEYAEAEIFLKKIISHKIEIGAVYNNLANFYFLQGNYEESELLFIKAGKLEKKSGVPYYNLSRTYIQQNFDLEKSSKALELAFKRDPSLSIIQTTDDNRKPTLQTETKLIFMSLPDNFYRRYADAQPGKEIYLPEFLQRILFPRANRSLYFALVIFSICSLLYLLRKTPGNRRICSDCGHLFHPIQKLKEKQCPVCYLNTQSQKHSLLNTLEETPNRQPVSMSTISLATIGALLPGFYQLIAGNLLIAAALMIPTTIWLYNFIIFQTGIMAPFPPSSSWLNTVFPGIIWLTNFIVLTFLIIFRHGTTKLSRSRP